MASSPSVKKATFLQLTFMIYGVACAGAFGLEDMVPDAGFYHGGTYNGKHLSPTAGLITLRNILTLGVYPRLYAMSKKLADGYNATISAPNLSAKNYRDWRICTGGCV